MGKRSKSDVSNHAIRILLQDIGKFYDEQRGFEPFKNSKENKEQILISFNNKCCYCGIALTKETVCLDHLIPTNKKAMGLTAWGNLVPSCRSCNARKHSKNWEDFLKLELTPEIYKIRKNRIKLFLKKNKYNPRDMMNLREYAETLYEDVGEVILTLIKLRFKQAEVDIKESLK